MIATTQGIVFQTTLYSESSIIAKVFTREWGLRSYIIKRGKSAKSRHRSNLLEPLSCLDMVVYNNNKKTIQYVKELKPIYLWKDIPFNSVKISLLFFMNEFLYKTIREEECNCALFDYITDCLQILDEQKSRLSDFPILFLLKASEFMGIQPLNNYDHENTFFNLQEGRFQPNSIFANTDALLHSDISFLLWQYLVCNQNGYPITSLESRNQLLRALLEYYKIHIGYFSDFQSHYILHDILK